MNSSSVNKKIPFHIQYMSFSVYFGVSLIKPRKTSITFSIFLVGYLPCCQFQCVFFFLDKIHIIKVITEII